MNSAYAVPLTEENHRLMALVKSHLNISYAEQIAFIFCELSRVDISFLLDIVRKDHTETKYVSKGQKGFKGKFRKNITLNAERLDVPIIHAILNQLEEEETEYTVKELLAYLIDYYMKTYPTYSNFIERYSNKEQKKKSKYYAYRIDHKIFDLMDEYVSQFGMVVSSFLILKAMNDLDHYIENATLDDYVQTKFDFVNSDDRSEKKKKRLQYTVYIEDDLLKNKLNYRSTEITEFLFLLFLKEIKSL